MGEIELDCCPLAANWESMMYAQQLYAWAQGGHWTRPATEQQARLMDAFGVLNRCESMKRRKEEQRRKAEAMMGRRP